jgi:septum formation protein
VRLALASSSPRRREILEALQLEHEVLNADVDETRLPDEAPAVYVERVAGAKARAVAAPGLIVIGADTAVVHEGRVMGKPGHPEEARAMLRRLQGNVHEVFTGLAICSWDSEPRVRSLVDVAQVELLSMTEEEIADYVDTGEPMDKAGSYALQGLGGIYVASVIGSPYTVIGLPIHLLPRLIAASGADIAAFKTGITG